MLDNPSRLPRFPYVAALLCAACVGAAAWMWMAHSYAWDVTVKDVHYLAGDLYPRDDDYEDTRQRSGKYVRVRGLVVSTLSVDKQTRFLYLANAQEPDVQAMVRVRNASELDGQLEATGRVMKLSGYEWWHGYPPVVDTTASRFTGASVAGLVVGAMGVFVFAVALRHWLGERSKFREEERA